MWETTDKVLNNNSSIYYSVPEWIISEDQVSGKNLVKLTQIISNYFDVVSNQIENLTKLKEISYTSGSLSNFEKNFLFEYSYNKTLNS